MPLLHPLEPALLGGLEALALDGLDVDDDRPVGGERGLERAAQGADVVAVDRPDVGEVELLEQQARRGVGLDRRLDLRAEPLDLAAEAERQLRQPALDVLAGVVEPRVEARALEQARERADVRRDRHPVVVEDDHDRRLQAAGVVERLERDAAGERAVADHRDDLAVVADPVAHRLLEPDRVADRGRRVAGAHDVVLGLGDRAERRQAVVLADRLEPGGAPGEDLVRVGLVADVPEDLVARRVEQAWRTVVSSQVPRLAPKWPPISPIVSMISSRTSCATWASSASPSPVRSSGESIESSRRAWPGVGVSGGVLIEPGSQLSQPRFAPRLRAI